MIKHPAIYILANKKKGTMYVGVSSDLPKRIAEHKSENYKGFTQKYECKKLVYYEVFDSMEEAIIREKRLKGGSRKKKVALIESNNPNWDDLYETLS